MPSSFSDVARAFSPDFTGIADEAFRGRQLAQQASQFNEQMGRKREEDRNDYLAKVGNIKPSDTPYDTYAIPRFRQLQSSIADYIKKNPRARSGDIERMFGQDLRDTQYGMGVASSLNKQLADRVAAASKDNAVLDQNLYRNDVLKSAFYDENGQLRSVPEANALINPQYDLSNPDNLAQYSNPSLVNNEFSRRFKEGFKPSPYTNPSVIDPNTGIKAPYTQELTPFDRAAQDGIGRERNYNNISVGDKQYNLLGEDQAKLFEDDNITRSSLLNARKKYKDDEAFASLPKPVQDRIVMADLVDANIGAVNYGESKWNTSLINVADRRKQQATNNSFQQQRIDLQKEGLEIRRKNQELRQQAKKTFGNNKLIDVFNYALDPKDNGKDIEELKPEGKVSPQVIAAASQYFTGRTKDKTNPIVAITNPDKAQVHVNAIDISRGANKKGYLINRNTGEAIKPILLKDKLTGRTVLVEQVMSLPVKNKDGTISPMKIVDTRAVPPEMKMPTLKGYQSDYGLKEADLDGFVDRWQDEPEEDNYTE